MQINFVYISPVFEKFELSNMLFLKQKAQQNSKEKRHMCFLSWYIRILFWQPNYKIIHKIILYDLETLHTVLAIVRFYKNIMHNLITSNILLTCSLTYVSIRFWFHRHNLYRCNKKIYCLSMRLLSIHDASTALKSLVIFLY